MNTPLLLNVALPPLLVILFPLPTFTNPNAVSPKLNVVPLFVIVWPFPTVYTPTDSPEFPVVILPATFTFPPLEYIAIEPLPTVILPFEFSSYPYIPTALSPTVILPTFIKGLVPVEVALVYIATFGLLKEAEFPNVIFPVFLVVYAALFFANFAYIPTFLSPVLEISPVFSNATVDVIFPGS